MNNKFSDGSQSAYAELPVKAAYLTWTRGNAQLRAIKDSDPGIFYGGWRAFVKGQDNLPLPTLPIPVVTRVSADGKHEYQVYATNILHFLPIQHRTRFEMRQRTKDTETGREYDKVIAISNKRETGYAPYRQVFGLVYAPDNNEFAPAVIKVFKWSAFISFERAGQMWNKITLPDNDSALVRRYGTTGLKDGGPKFETFGQSHSTPIEAIDIAHPRFVDVTPYMLDLLEATIAWKECARWNAEGEVVDEAEKSAKQEFLEKCDAIGLSNIDIEQLLKENNNNYAAALFSLAGGEEPNLDDINTALADSEEE